MSMDNNNPKPTDSNNEEESMIILIYLNIFLKLICFFLLGSDFIVNEVESCFKFI